MVTAIKSKDNDRMVVTPLFIACDGNECVSSGAARYGSTPGAGAGGDGAGDGGDGAPIMPISMIDMIDMSE